MNPKSCKYAVDAPFLKMLAKQIQSAQDLTLLMAFLQGCLEAKSAYGGVILL